MVLKEEPSSFTILAVLSCILCFPFGIYALIKSDQVKCSSFFAVFVYNSCLAGFEMN